VVPPADFLGGLLCFQVEIDDVLHPGITSWRERKSAVPPLYRGQGGRQKKIRHGIRALLDAAFDMR
jgi:hypothetical protein